MSRPDTPQTLDPLSGLTARTVVYAAVALSVAAALLSSLRGWPEVVSPLWAAVSLSAVVAAAVTLCAASSPFRAPFRARDQVLLTVLLMVAIVAEAAASFGANTVILDSYGYLVAALFLFPLGSYRPYPAILATTGVLAVTQASAALVQAPALVGDYPSAVYAVVTAAPILAGGVGAAALSRYLVREQREQGIESVAAGRSDAVHVQPLAIIDDEVLPLLQRVTTGRTVTRADAEAAREVGARLRDLLVAESDASVLPSWLGGIHDPHGHLRQWNMRQRAATYAYAARVIPPVAHPDASLTVDEDAGWTFTVAQQGGASPSRDALAPFIATLGVAFGGVQVERTRTWVTVRGRGPIER